MDERTRMSGLHRHSLNLPGRLSGVTSTIRAPLPSVAACPPVDATKPSVDAESIAKLQAGLNAAVAEVRMTQEKTRNELAVAAASLSVEIAELLLHCEIARDRQRLDRILNAMLEQASAASGVVVRGHPDDLALLQKQLDEHTLIGAAGEELTFRADENASRGSLKLETADCLLEWNTPRYLADLKARLIHDIYEAD
jgi:flagellar biosynthesis/type III secretory pathway protein FliH